MTCRQTECTHFNLDYSQMPTWLDVLVVPFRLLPTEVGNLLLTCGRKRESSWGRSCFSPQHTTPQPMGWSKAFIVRLKQLLSATIIPLLGTKILASFYLVSAPWSKRMLAAALLSLDLAPPCACQDNFFRH